MARTPEIQVFGSFQARWSDGETIRIYSKKAQALLAFLAIERSRQHSREALATLLWGNTGEERARHNLRQSIAKIRSTCDCLLMTSRDCLQFNQSACLADVVQFETLSKCEDSHSLMECLELYRGELLEGLNVREPDYADWLMMARTRLRSEACEVAARLGGLLIEQNQDNDAITVFNRMLAVDPANEFAHRHLIVLLDRAGRRSEALRQYQLCIEAMKRELGAEPGIETQRIIAGLRSSSDKHPQLDRTTAEASDCTGPKRPAVAVIPFENLSDSSDDYFADGMAEDLVTALSCFQTLVVIARGSSFAFRGSELSDREIAARLGADFLVRGSVRRSGHHVRINVHLLDPSTNLNIWGHRYDRELEDVFLVQDEITSTLVSTLAGRVEAAQLRQARKAPPERLDAHDLLLRGRHHHHQFTIDDCKACIDMFERAIERDPGYAPAHAWLACGLGQAMTFELDDLSKLLDQSQEAAERGTALDDNDSECHRVLAQVFLDRCDLTRAMHHQERALRLNPNDDRIVNAMGELLVYCGEAKEAENWVRNSMRLNPYHPQRYWTHLVRALYHQGKFEEALEALQQIEHPRKDDFTYCIATLHCLGDSDSCEGKIVEMEERFPGFDPVALVNALPFRKESDRQALLETIRSCFSTRAETAASSN